MVVSRACKPGGRLEKFAVRNATGRVTEISDPETARQHWVDNTSHNNAPASIRIRDASRAGQLAADHGRDDSNDPDRDTLIDDLTTRVEADRVQAIWKARQLELKFKEEAKELVPVADVKQEIESVFSEVRTKVLGLVPRLRQEDPALTGAQLALIERVLREALEGLAAQ